MSDKYLNPNDGSTNMVLVDVEFLTEVAGFLLASSRYEDMGELPYSSFIRTSHYLATVIEEHFADIKLSGVECYNQYNLAEQRYLQDPVVVKFNEELDKLLGGK